MKQDEVVERLGTGGRQLVLLLGHGTGEREDWVESNENGTFTFDSYRVFFDRAETLEGVPFDTSDETRVLVEGSMVYEAKNGKRYKETPCDDEAPTVAKRIDESNGGAVALLLQRFGNTHLVREVVPYRPDEDALAFAANVVTLDQFRDRVVAAAGRPQRGVPWIEEEGRPPYDPDVPGLPQPTAPAGPRAPSRAR